MGYINKAVFYESYHRNIINKLIHVFFIPILLWTGLSISYHVDNMIPIFVGSLYGGYYVYLDRKVGISYLFILATMLFNLKTLSLTGNILLHIFSWAVQILSHKYIEKNSPALITGFWDSFTIAPFFVWMEIWWFFGYNKVIHKKIRHDAWVLYNRNMNMVNC
jgi:2-hydroxy fatty acid dioxygenase